MSNLVVVEKEDLRAMLAEACADAVRAALGDVAPASAPAGRDARAIVPDRLYSAEEANALLGFGDRLTIYEIPEHDLPKCRVGPKRGATRYLGANLLAYALGLPVPELGPMLERARGELEARLSSPGRIAGTVGERPGRRRVV